MAARSGTHTFESYLGDTGVDAMNTQRLMAKYSAKYSAGVTDVLDSAEFTRLRQEIISPQDKIMGTLEQVATSRIITRVLGRWRNWP